MKTLFLGVFEDVNGCLQFYFIFSFVLISGQPSLLFDCGLACLKALCHKVIPALWLKNFETRII